MYQQSIVVTSLYQHSHCVSETTTYLGWLYCCLHRQVGTLLPVHERYLLVASRGREEEAFQRLARVGFDTNLVGVLEGGIEAWVSAGRPVTGESHIPNSHSGSTPSHRHFCLHHTGASIVRGVAAENVLCHGTALTL